MQIGRLRRFRRVRPVRLVRPVRKTHSCILISVGLSFISSSLQSLYISLLMYSSSWVTLCMLASRLNRFSNERELLSITTLHDCVLVATEHSADMMKS